MRHILRPYIVIICMDIINFLEKLFEKFRKTSNYLLTINHIVLNKTRKNKAIEELCGKTLGKNSNIRLPVKVSHSALFAKNVWHAINYMTMTVMTWFSYMKFSLSWYHYTGFNWNSRLKWMPLRVHKKIH